MRWGLQHRVTLTRWFRRAPHTLSYKYTRLQTHRPTDSDLHSWFTPAELKKIDQTQGQLIHSCNIHISSLLLSASLHILQNPSFLPSIWSTLRTCRPFTFILQSASSLISLSRLSQKPASSLPRFHLACSPTYIISAFASFCHGPLSPCPLNPYSSTPGSPFHLCPTLINSTPLTSHCVCVCVWLWLFTVGIAGLCGKSRGLLLGISVGEKEGWRRNSVAEDRGRRGEVKKEHRQGNERKRLAASAPKTWLVVEFY